MQVKNKEDMLYEAIYSSVIDSEDIADMCLDESAFRSICLLPFWFFSCCKNHQNVCIENELISLGKANLQAWISSVLYDRVWSKKVKKNEIKAYLSTANTLYRKSMHQFYSLVNYDKDRMDIINAILNQKHIQRFKNMSARDIHFHFRSMCENSHKKMASSSITCIIILWILGHDTIHMKAYDFLKNYLNARQLEKDNTALVDDMLNNVCTPATFLMRAKYGSRYVHTMMRSRIDLSMKRTLSSVKTISFFDHQKFTRLHAAK